MNNLLRLATGDGRQAVIAAKWWTQARMGWRETTQIAGADGGPIAVSYVVRAPTPVESADEWLKQHAPQGESS